MFDRTLSDRYYLSNSKKFEIYLSISQVDLVNKIRTKIIIIFKIYRLSFRILKFSCSSNFN